MPISKPMMILPAALMALTACNGGAGTSAQIDTSPGANDAWTRGEIAAVSDDIFQGVRNETATPKADVPFAGSAGYAGTMQMDIETARARSDVAGLIEMDVDFGRDRVTGAMGNFVEADGERITGTLGLQNGRLDRRVNSSEVAIFSDFGGRLTGPGGERIDVDGDLSGGFAGRDVGYIGAELDGRVSVDGAPGSLSGLTALER